MLQAKTSLSLYTLGLSMDNDNKIYPFSLV